MNTVACKWCGGVFEKAKACKSVRCPICDTTADSEPIPKHGHCEKWWEQ